jgi:hypothetical protein
MLEKSVNKKQVGFISGIINWLTLLRFDGVKKHLGLRLGIGEFK